LETEFFLPLPFGGVYNNGMLNKNDYFISPTQCWIFAYGSLMWDFPFPYIRKEAARLSGYHRSFCMASVVYRGTKDNPGLVLSLDQGGFCDGIAYKLPEEHAYPIFEAVWNREMITNAYLPQILSVVLNGGPETVKALCFTVNPAHEQYVAMLPLAEQARIIKGAHGQSGPNLDYALSTLRHLQALYIQDTEMVALGGALGGVFT
jgi:cation transport protein ChaC